MLAFLEVAARTQDMPDLGWRAVARARVEQLGGWGLPVARSETLGEALRRLCDLYPKEISFVELGLSPGSGHAWLWRRRTVSVGVTISSYDA